MKAGAVLSVGRELDSEHEEEARLVRMTWMSGQGFAQKLWLKLPCETNSAHTLVSSQRQAEIAGSAVI